jgi:hypothetical protein
MSARPAPAAQTRGIAVLIALITTFAMALSAVALTRSTFVTIAVGGNLALRQNAVFASFDAIERAVAAVYVGGTVADLDRDDPDHNYFSTFAADDDVRGVPRALQEVAAYPSAAETLDGGEGIDVRYVVERLCSAPGPPVIETCALSPPSVAAAAGVPAPGEPVATPYYRVTVRADGPGGTRVLTQAMLGAHTPGHRQSWRVLDE